MRSNASTAVLVGMNDETNTYVLANEGKGEVDILQDVGCKSGLRRRGLFVCIILLGGATVCGWHSR